MPMAAPGAAADVAGWEGEEQPAVFDTLETEQRVGQCPHLGHPPAERDQLEAVVMADVDVEDRDDQAVMVVLQRRHPLAELPRVVVVDERQAAEHLGLVGVAFDTRLDQRVAH